MIRNKRSRLSLALTMALAASMAFAPAALAELRMSDSTASAKASKTATVAAGPQVRVSGSKAVTKTFTPSKTNVVTFLVADQKGVTSAELTKDGAKIEVALRKGRSDNTGKVSAIFSEAGEYTLTVKGGSGTTVKTITVSE